jgi:Ser/Thr protein kinase RdoA (MazF antagonist)
MAGGRADAVRLVTERGDFFVKTSYRAADAELYEQAVLVLARAGIRQARPLRTTAGSLVGESGCTVQEFLPGRLSVDPSPAQRAAVMRHVAAYHAALSSVAVPAWLREGATVWQRVASVDYLLAELPRLLDHAGLPAGSAGVVSAALAHLAAAAPRMRQLPAQLTHGDIGPDNVLTDGDDVVAVVDFTPHHAPAVSAIATAVYWYHVYGRDDVDLGAVRASWDAAGEGRPWSPALTER